MTTERWHEIEALFLAALERDPDRRADFLRESCGEDGELQAEVESLLAHDSKGAIEQTIRSAVATFDPDGVTWYDGRRIGAYRLIREIGRGGMGAVYLAARADDQFEKHVAIKLVKGGVSADSVLQRFRDERQILANLEHPNIARLLDGGTTEEGTPYLVMEYIAGTPIVDYCVRRGLSVANRLKLFRSVCLAVHYAHQNLVVHRDLKPGNILVAEDGTVKLLDFGIAKLVDPSAEKTAGAGPAQPLTPEYASPEQARGESLTTATDIYSLGAVLFELLSGRRPHQFTSYSRDEIEEAICERGVPGLSDAAAGRALRRRLSGDLEAIVRMAMSKRPLDRYASAEQFSEDIRRHLKGRAVIARDDSWSYRLGKVLMRNRVGVAAAVLLVSSLAGGMLATFYQARRAERRFELGRKLANSFLFEIHDAISEVQGSTRARGMLVTKTLEYLNNVAKDAKGDFSLQRDLAAAYQKIGDVQGHVLTANLGNTAGALESYRKALRILESAAEDRRDEDVQIAIATAHGRIGDILSYTGDAGGALASYETARNISAELTTADPSSNKAMRSLAAALRWVSRARGLMQQNAQALDSSRQSLKLYLELMKAEPGDRSLRQAIADCDADIGVMQARLNDLTGALKSYKRALAEQQALSAEDPSNVTYRRELMLAYSHVGDILGNPASLNLGDTAGALENYHKMLEIGESLAAADPSDTRAKSDFAISLMRVGNAISENRRHKEALEIFEKSARLMEELAAKDPRNMRIRMNLSFVARRSGDRKMAIHDLDGALRSYRRSVEVGERAAKADPKDNTISRILAEAYARFSLALAESGDRRGAIEAGRRGVALAEALGAVDSGGIRTLVAGPQSYAWMAAVYQSLARRKEAEPLRRDEDRKEACGWLRKSVTAWNGIEKKPGFTKTYTTELNRVAAQLGTCATLIAGAK